MKYKWKVNEIPTGRFSSFEKRGWPTAHYENGDYCASIECKDDYRPKRVKTGDHGPLKVLVADYSKRDENCPWTRRTIKGEFKTLNEAKEALKAIFAKYPQMMNNKKP